MPDLTIPNVSEEAIRSWAYSVNVPTPLMVIARKWLEDNEPPPPDNSERMHRWSAGPAGVVEAVRARDLRPGDRIGGYTVRAAASDSLNRALVRVEFEGGGSVLFYTLGTLVMLDPA